MKRLLSFVLALTLAAALFAAAPQACAAASGRIEAIDAKVSEEGITVTLPDEYGGKGYFKLLWKNSETGEVGSAVIKADEKEYLIETENAADWSLQLFYARKRGVLPSGWEEEPEYTTPVWKILWVDLETIDFMGVTNHTTENNRRTVDNAAAAFERIVEALSGGRVDIENERLTVTEPVTALSGDDTDGYYVSRTDFDVRHYAIHRYDMVFAFGRMDGIPALFYDGIAMGKENSMDDPGYSFIKLEDDEVYEGDFTSFAPLCIHEWFHVLDMFYENYRIKVPNPDETDKYGYGINPGNKSPVEFIADTLTMQVWDEETGLYIGVPEEAWQYAPTHSIWRRDLSGLQTDPAKQDVLYAGLEDLNWEADEENTGIIRREEIDLTGRNPLRVDMTDIFRLYPGHTGIYGVLYAEGEVSLAGNGETVSGTGVMEFAFPGAEECSLSGTGKVYAYFLPAPYLRLSAEDPAGKRKFDTSFLTSAENGRTNLFILSDPHVYIPQDDWTNNYWKGKAVGKNCPLGPAPAGYEHYAGSGDGFSAVSFAFDAPVLTQYCARTPGAYKQAAYTARPMVRLAAADRYEIWAPGDLRLKNDPAGEAEEVLAAAMALAEEQILAPEVKPDRITVILTDGEIPPEAEREDGVVSSELYDRIGYASQVWLEAKKWDKKWTDKDRTALARKIGKIVWNASLCGLDVNFARWLSEGFAAWFAGKVSASFGIGPGKAEKLNRHDAAEADKFRTNLVFGAVDFASTLQHENEMIFPNDAAAFGARFFRYLEDRFGEGFCRKISARFCRGWYQDQASRFRDRTFELKYAADDYFRLLREGLATDVYTAYPDWFDANK